MSCMNPLCLSKMNGLDGGTSTQNIVKKKKNLLHVLFQFQSPVYHSTLFYIISTKKVNVELCYVSRIFNSDLHLAKVGFSIDSDLYWFIEPLD